MNPFTWLRETKSWLWLAAVVALIILAVFVLRVGYALNPS